MKALLALAALSTCGGGPSALTGNGTRWPDADALFHQNPRWLGADAAYSVDLGADRTLWLFGDTFIATSPAFSRTQSTMVRNSIAVMTGRDPLTARMQFAWTDGAPPSAYFAGAGAADHWMWPAGGVRAPGGPAVIFLSEMRADTGGLGFAGVAPRAVAILNPDDPPAAWTVVPAPLRAPTYAPDATVGACVAVDGDRLVALAVDGDAHQGRLARWRLGALPDLSGVEWWDGAAWTADDRAPAVVIPDGATECSLHRDPSGLWVHLFSRGFGATTVAIRTAPDLVGPWSDATDVFTPPESRASNAFVYAAKAHPELTTRTPGALVVTYADNSFTFADLFDPARVATLYWPHVAELELGP